jgi:exonuclease SbcD
MKLLHTADWHIGKTLKGRSRLEEQTQICAEIVRIAEREAVDAVLVSGDLYDTASPSPAAQHLVHHTLLKLHGLGIHVVVIAGNHDRASGFDALRPLMSEIGIQYLGEPRTPGNGGVHRFATRSGERAVVAMVPFVSRRYAVRAQEIVTNTPVENAGLYEDSVRAVLDALSAGFGDDTVNIVMAHLTCTGGVMGGGEREAQSVFEYHVSAQAFRPDTHYVALGHLHRRQSIPAACPVHYSGSPFAVDFGEEANQPVVCLVEVTPSTPAKVTDIPITSAKRLVTLSGTAAEVIEQGRRLPGAFLRVILLEPLRAGLRDEVVEALPHALEVRLHPDFLPSEAPPAARRSSASPRDLFAAYCEQANLVDPEVVALFDELADEMTSEH